MKFDIKIFGKFQKSVDGDYSSYLNLFEQSVRIVKDLVSNNNNKMIVIT